MKVTRWIEVPDREAPSWVEHGTSNRYKNYGCRCGPCSDAGSRWMRDYYRRTNGLQEMVRSGEPMELGSQGGQGARGHHKNATRKSGQVQDRKKKPMVVDFESDESD